MRILDTSNIYTVLRQTIEQAICSIEPAAQKALCDCALRETSPAAKWSLDILAKNCTLAEKQGLPACQDTGMAVIFLEIGQDVCLQGEYIENTLNRAVRDAYAPFRKSVAHPLTRQNTSDNTPAVIHTKITLGDKVKISFMAKGFGSENQSRIYMLTPNEGEQGVINAALDTVKRAGSLPCPPILLGIGIGGTMEKSALLAKYALLRKTAQPHADPATARLEGQIFARVNGLKIGAQGFGGDSTCLAVHIETFATHIAGLPVAVNMQCHSVRHGEVIL